MLQFMDIIDAAPYGEKQAVQMAEGPAHKIVIHYPEPYLNRSSETDLLPRPRVPVLNEDGFIIGVKVR